MIREERLIASESGVTVVKSLNEDKVDADLTVHLNVCLDFSIAHLDRSVPYCTRGYDLALCRCNNDKLTKLLNLKLAVVILHKKGCTAVIGKVRILESNLDLLLNGLELIKLNLNVCNILVKSLNVKVIKLLNSLLRYLNVRLNAENEVLIVAVKGGGDRECLIHLIKSYGCAKNCVGTDEVTTCAVTGNYVTALGNLGNVYTELNYNAVCINSHLVAVYVSTCTCGILILPAVLINNCLVGATECGELCGSGLHTLGVGFLSGVDVVEATGDGAAKTNKVKAYHLNGVANAEELACCKKLTVALTVCGENEAVIGNLGAGVVALKEATEADYNESVLIEIILADNLGTEAVGTCLCAELIVIVNYHGSRTVSVCVVNNNSLTCGGLNRLGRNNELLVLRNLRGIERNNVANLCKCRMLGAAYGKNEAAYGNVGLAIAACVNVGNNILAVLKLTGVLGNVAGTACCGIGIICSVDNRVVVTYCIVTDLIVVKRAATCNLPEINGVGICVANGLATNGYRDISYGNITGKLTICRKC